MKARIETEAYGVVFCNCHHDLAKALGKFFDETVKVSGRGLWKRTAEGSWKIDDFTITDYRPVELNGLRQSVNKISSLGIDWPNNPIGRSSAINLAPFDARSAIELALWTKREIENGDKKGGSAEGWQKVKFDRQIASIAKANGAVEFYSNDSNQTDFAKILGMSTKHSWDLPIPQNMGNLFDEQK